MTASMATRVGIATGRVIVGDVLYNLESVERPVIGETPNLAARLQGIAPLNSVVISATTRQMIGGLFEVSDLGELELKGFQHPMRAFRVERETAGVERFSALRGSHLSAFVGRDRERELLLQAWRAAAAGVGKCVYVVGEGGIGKSRLTHWMRETAVADGATEQRYDCSAYHGGSAFYPIVRHLEASARIVREDDAAVRWAKLAALVDADGLSASTDLPVLAKLLQIPIPTGTSVPRLEPIQEKEIVVTSVITRLRHQAQPAPVLLVVEDVHWIDPSSTELFGRVLAEIVALPVLALFCYRPEFVPPWPSSEALLVVELSRLAPESCRLLAESLADGGQLSQEVMQQIIARTDGVPLFVEELTKAVLESGAGLMTGESVTDGTRPEDAIPATLHYSLLARLDRLGGRQAGAQVAACVGREFGRDLLQRVAGLADLALDHALSQLLASSLVVRESEGGSISLQARARPGRGVRIAAPRDPRQLSPANRDDSRRRGGRDRA